ncbi:MAG: hypothetical protein Q7R83_00680 [bacterium]|nr:hypothetical protein [bacterium]
MEHAEGQKSLEVVARSLSSVGDVLSRLGQNELVSIAVEAGKRDPLVYVGFLLVDRIPQCAVSGYHIPLIFRAENVASVRGFFSLPENGAEMVSGNAALATLSTEVLEQLAAALRLVRDPETGKETRRLHLVSELEETRFRFAANAGGNGADVRWSSPLSGGPAFRSKGESVLVLDVSARCAAAYGLRSPNKERDYPELVLFPLLEGSRIAAITQPHAWQERTYSVLGRPFVDGSRIRRSNHVASALVTFEALSGQLGGEVRLVSFSNKMNGRICWSEPILNDGSVIIGRYFLPDGFGLVMVSGDRHTVTVVPQSLLESFFGATWQSLRPYFDDEASPSRALLAALNR